jgi:hypothetical protein
LITSLQYCTISGDVVQSAAARQWDDRTLILDGCDFTLPVVFHHSSNWAFANLQMTLER